MSLTPQHRAQLELLGVENVRGRLRHAGPAPGSVVPGIGDGMAVRGDVEDWLSEQDREAARQQHRRFWWTTGLTVTGIIIGVIVAFLVR